MKFEDLWERYRTEEITELSDVIIEVFKTPLSDAIREEYDVGEIITEFSGHHETAKKYDKIESFTQVLKANQKETYEEVGDYLNEALVQYYCFRNDQEKVKENIVDFTERAHKHELFFTSLRQVQCYGYSEVVNLAVEKGLEDSEDLTTFAYSFGLEFLEFKYAFELQQCYLHYLEHQTYDWANFAERLAPYGYAIKEDYLSDLKAGFLTTIEDYKKSEEAASSFKKRAQSSPTLEILFLKYMWEKNCPFTVAKVIWQEMLLYLEGRTVSSIDRFLDFDQKSFEKFLSDKGGLFLDSTHDIALIIWGSSYFFQFLRHLEVIAAHQCEAYEKTIDTIKSAFKERQKHYLWKYSFVHNWAGHSPKEKEQFTASYDLPIDKREVNKLNWGRLFNAPFESSLSATDQEPGTLHAVSSHRPAKKIGRNEKVTVKYKDGTIKKGVKYKHVQKDIERGDGELI